MSIYKYKAISKEKRTVSGLVEAGSIDGAAEVLQEKGFVILSLKQEAEEAKHKYLGILNRVKAKDLVVFSRQFAVMVSANVTIVQALKILVDQTANIKLKVIISEIAFEVDSGSKLSDAMAKRPNIFSDFFTSVIRSGETSGRLDDSLNYLADEMEKDYDMMHKIRGALIYPAFIVATFIVVMVLMMTVIVPNLTTLLTETGQQLPFCMGVVVSVSNFMTRYIWLLIILFGASIGFFINYGRSESGREVLARARLDIPAIGYISKNSTLAHLG